MASHAARGKKALDNKDYDEAISAYTAAINESPTSADYFIQRSTAYQRYQKNAEALNDADQAVLNAQARSKLELIVEAQFRRGVALFSLGRFADAKFVLDFVKRRNDKHKMADMWIGKTDLKLKSLPEDDVARKCTVTETPSPPAIVHSETPSAGTKAVGNESTSTAAAESASANSAPSAPDTKSAAPAPQQTPANKIRYDWYQNTEKVYFTLLAKGVSESAEINIAEHSLSISFATGIGATYELALDPLFAAIDVEKSTKRILSTKVEIVLAKAVPGQKWGALEGQESTVTTSAQSDGKATDDHVRKAVLSPSAAAAKSTAPAYPTSSKSGPKNWDNITSDLTEGNGKGGGDDDDAAEGADAFFKKLFKSASPDMQRAMMKSYTESNGTSLSTNWEEVSKGPVETLPPDGMEAKKW